MPAFSKTQIDKLGERLKAETIAPDDIRMLDEYRASFEDHFENVLVILKDTGLLPTGRTKSNQSIIEKLLREHIRLSQMQDIVGCRVVVNDLDEQDGVVEAIRKTFADISLIDRRVQPNHGYRAVHAIIRQEQQWVEVQIRTTSQHTWAEYSERLSDELDHAIKYGGIPKIAKELENLSNLLQRVDQVFVRSKQIRASLVEAAKQDEISTSEQMSAEELASLTEELVITPSLLLEQFAKVHTLTATMRAKLLKERAS